MIKVSNLFKSKIYGPERQTKGKVSFEILDVEAYDDVTLSVSSEAEISRVSQSVNKVREMSHKYATYEPDYFALDGSFHLPPKETQGDSELGWWSDEFSGEDGTFAVSPQIEFNFTKPHSSIGLTVTFDKNTNEYASDFRIEVFDGTGAYLIDKTVTGNLLAEFILEQSIENYQRILITILKWATPERRARLVEVDFGVIREYTGEKLISLKTVEEMDLLASTVPSNEIEFTLDNSDNLFNILNPEGVYRFLKANQEMNAQIGLLIGEEKYEYISLGKYFLDEWVVEEGAMTSSFVGRDIFTKLDAIDYIPISPMVETNLYDLAVDVLTQANVSKYKIDDKLKSITTMGFPEKINTREALQMIAIAGRTAIRQDRYGFVTLETFEALAFETGYLEFASPDLYIPTTPQVYQDYTFQVIDLETAYEIPKVTLATAVTHLVFKVHDPTGSVIDYKIVNSQVKEGQGFEINNPLINSEAQALEVAEWMFKEYSLIAEYQANWRQNPALECGDIILIEDRFGSKKKARITKQEINFNGYLNGISEAKGGI